MFSSSSPEFLYGVSAAVSAPFLMVLGFMIWDDHWTKKKGSAFSLNMFKCNITAFLFLIVIIAIDNREESGQTSSSTSTETITVTDATLISRVHMIYERLNPFERNDVKFLIASSTVGILIGDWAWIEGLKYLGARKVIVMDTLKPFLAAFAGRIFFDEKFKSPLTASAGLMFSVVGVALVGLEVESEEKHKQRECGVVKDAHDGDLIQHSNELLNSTIEQKRIIEKSHFYGIFVAILNVFLHTLGATLTKKFGSELTTWEINFVRFGFSGLCMLLLSSLLIVRDHILQDYSQSPGTSRSQSADLRKSSTTRTKHYGSVPTRDLDLSLPYCSNQEDTRWYALPTLPLRSWVRVTFGVLFVSFLNPALTNYAMFQIPLALLLTLESIGPLYSLPLALIIQKESPSLRALIGAVLAVTGIILLSFQGK
mmetsp:Transcript_21893/g.52091  ORF Transcript_21893/g.52091 Transcript_21893/m.52091 type:complete len:426 (-) Transcript_21893:124-1401(-)